MRRTIAVVIVSGLIGAATAVAQPEDRNFWPQVQALCNQTAALPANDRSRAIARLANEEFERVGGHQIDADGRMFRFGVVESEHEEDPGSDGKALMRNLGWWHVFKYWRSLYEPTEDHPKQKPGDVLDVWGYRNAISNTAEDDEARLLEMNLTRLLAAIDTATVPDEDKDKIKELTERARDILRQAAVRAAINDNAWSAAFISYVVKSANVAPEQFPFSSRHRTYIYQAFRTSRADVTKQTDGRLYRACPVHTTRLRVGDMICYHREKAYAGLTAAEIRDKILAETAPGASRTIAKTHCDIVAHVDTGAQKVYVIGGNVYQSVTVKKLNLFQGALSPNQAGTCPPWTLPRAKNVPSAPSHRTECSLNDKAWFVLLQMRSDP